ncbi:MAG: protein kinase [Firmicutes bacterium]|nr:protein kinase [Bacillota bacterium]
MIGEDKFAFGKRYEVQEEIGSGGMGRVFRVHDSVKNQTLALKEINRYLLDSPLAQLRFKNEFRVMSEFEHPNMIKVYEYGTSPDKTPYIVMEYIPGKNLSSLSPVPVQQAADLLARICQALGYLHSRLYVHRDLKPDNIKLLEDGSIKLLDYGLMCQLGIPGPEKISGTFYYIAPEVFTGGIIDETTDLYSLGIIGYEILTGKRPFTGTKSEIIKGHLRKSPDDLMTLRPDVPPSFNEIIKKLLAKEKDKRYRNAAEVLEDLRHLTEGELRIETAEQKHGYLYSSKLIGRNKETERFRDIFYNFLQGKPRTLYLGAPAGIGKSRLLHELKTISQLEQVETVMVGAQYAGSRIYGLIENLAKQLHPLCEGNEIDVCDKAIAWLSGFRDEEYAASGEKRSTEEVTANLKSLLKSISSGTPLVIFLDDLQWMDLKSLNILNELLRDNASYRVLFVGGFRSNEVDKASPIWHTVEEDISEYMELAPFTPEQTGELMKHLLYPTEISSDFLNFAYDNSGGNVFDLIELLRHLITDGKLVRSGNIWKEPISFTEIKLPGTIEDRLIHRIEKLSAEARNLAEAASVLGEDLDLENWLAVSGCSEEDLFSAVDELLHNQVMVQVSGVFRFAHHKIQTALYASIPHEKGRAYHLAAAKFFESVTDRDVAGLIPRIAYHFTRADSPSEAVHYSLLAAKEAELNNAEWEAFDHYKNAVRFIEKLDDYPEKDKVLFEIYEKAAVFNSAAWIDAITCLDWLQKAIDHYKAEQNTDKVFSLSLSYIVASSISSNYEAARRILPEIIETCKVEEGTLTWAILFGAGVCLNDWYQGYQMDLFNHAQKSIEIFESQLDKIPEGAWGPYSWALFWREKARAYTGQPVNMDNIEKIHQLMLSGKSDMTIYWHTLTSVGARAAFSGKYKDLLEWKELASKLSSDMGKIHWFECWISHSYLYGTLHRGDFSQLENHIERVQASPDPYQVRLAYLFRGRLRLIEGKFKEAEENLNEFLRLEKLSTDNSLLEGYVFLAELLIKTGRIDEARTLTEEGAALANSGKLENPLYKMQFEHLKALISESEGDYSSALSHLDRALKIAKEQTNPIQEAFIKENQGLVRLKMSQIQDGLALLNQAKELFLSLDNKFQAGRITSLLESKAQTTETPAAPKAVKQSAGILDKTVGDEAEPRTEEDEQIQQRQIRKSIAVSAKSETDAEEVGLDATEADI